jgi:hypothetical protein
MYVWTKKRFYVAEQERFGELQMALLAPPELMMLTRPYSIQHSDVCIHLPVPSRSWLEMRVA